MSIQQITWVWHVFAHLNRSVAKTALVYRLPKPHTKQGLDPHTQTMEVQTGNQVKCKQQHLADQVLIKISSWSREHWHCALSQCPEQVLDVSCWEAIITMQNGQPDEWISLRELLARLHLRLGWIDPSKWECNTWSGMTLQACQRPITVHTHLRMFHDYILLPTRYHKLHTFHP